MRLDHLLSKEKSKGWIAVDLPRGKFAVKETATKNSGGDALRGHTRSHPEHEG